MKKYNKVFFKFENSSITFSGYSDGSKWNGFDNVCVGKKTHKLVLKYLIDIMGLEDYYELIKNTNFSPNGDGLISYAKGKIVVKINE